MDSSYESFRNKVTVELEKTLNPQQISMALHAIDMVSGQFDFSPKEISLAKVGGIPEILAIYIASKAVENLSKETLKLYKGRLVKFFSAMHKPFDQITSNDIRLYLYAYKQQGVGDSTVEAERLILSAFFGWLVNNEYLIRNPVSKVAKIKYQQVQRQPLTPYDLELLKYHCKDEREKAIVNFLFSTGCRLAECSDVLLSDIDWKTHEVVIRHGKGNKKRITFFDSETELTLKLYLKTRNDNDPHLFVRGRKPIAAISKRGIERIIKAVKDRADISKCTPHVLRHTFATTCIRNGMPLEQVQALMGHSKPETTMIYIHQEKTDLQMAHRKAFS